jgi:hypothetical protein
VQRKLGFRVIRVVIYDDSDQPMYDQILIGEKGGVVFLPYDPQGRVGLLKIFRPVTKDQALWREQFPDIRIEDLGRESWEIPRGMAKLEERNAKDSVTREAEEETSGCISKLVELGHNCVSTTFMPNLTHIYMGQVDLSRKSSFTPDPHDGLLSKLHFFTQAELAEMVRTEKLFCAFTFAALAMTQLLHPGLLK